MADNHDKLLRQLGSRVRKLRDRDGVTRAQLAASSGLSTRYLAELEAGQANISVARLADVADALRTTLASLLASAPSQQKAVALLGLRGAGKTTVGNALSQRLGWRFVELDSLVEAESGMPLASLFEIHGDGYYRRLERDCLTRFLAETERSVLATGGGIVAESQTFDALRRDTLTVWLKARPADHWDRVVEQGDHRPMANRREAYAELRTLLAARAPLYALADLVVDTSSLGVSEAAEFIAEELTLTKASAL